MALTLRYAVRSDLGLVRGNNEDSVYAGPRLLAIADGMGGHAAGEVASKIVIGTMEPLDDDRVAGDLITAMREAVLESNNRIADAVDQDPQLDGMGTTLTALRFAGSQVALVHVGDSRAYLLRGEVFEQITHDDTYVQYLVDSGKLTAEEAKDHPRKSVILRALRGADVEPDVAIREARAGDRYLLCSDGLSDVVSSETIAETLRIPDPQETADRLVELALRSGGPDNVTVIVADVIDARPGDVVDDVPVRDGAFVDPAAAEVTGSDSAAERAAAISRPLPRKTDAAPEKAHHSGRWKTPAIIVAILALIVAALGGTYAWAQTQYYVGRAGGEVAIYRGVNASFGPIKFSEVYENTDLKLADLNSSWRDQVESGITASSKADARAIVVRLHDEQLPLCSSLPTNTPTPSPTITPSTSASSTSAARTTPPASSKVSRPAGATSSAAASRLGTRSTLRAQKPAPTSSARTPVRAAAKSSAAKTSAARTSAARTSAARTSAKASTARTSAPTTPSATPPSTPGASSSPLTSSTTPSVPGLPSGSGKPECRP